ncbi:MAG: serine/threonine protein kinase [Pirellulaceae bacterium]|nr:serine/threonine protein kinase [Pirellulaceae bacterium]
MQTPSCIENRSLAAARLGRTAQIGFGFFRRHLWIVPLLMAAMIGVAGFWIRLSVEAAAKHEVANILQTILAADVKALDIWMENHIAQVQTIANQPQLQKLAIELAREVKGATDPTSAAIASSLRPEIDALLRPDMVARRYIGFVLIDTSGLVLASSHVELVGTTPPPPYDELIRRVLAAGATVTRPVPSKVLLRDETGELKAGVPTMFAAATLRDQTGEPIGVLALRIRPEVEFTEILQVAATGATGETYAFDKEGRILSESRFTSELIRAGLLPDQPGVRSTLNLTLKDPGVNMVQGGHRAPPRGSQPFTQMVASGIREEAGINVDGFRDYRGVPVVAAWQWLPAYNFGVGTQIDVAEAFQPLYIMRRAFWGLFGLLATAGVLVLAFTVITARLQAAAHSATLAAKELGQYRLEEKLGEGGMGVVYRGQHKLLRRPTAIKLLHPEKTTDAAIARFEREVQLTCQLNHPNTIAIFDYGRTPDGIFFYAMEYLDGLNLETLVKRFGHQPEGRVIHILRQLCGSLAEAHEIGLVHRDIKPANLVLNRRGGIGDVLKVLDFGLVKANDATKEAALTAANTIIGTPHYMSPEAVEASDTVDARSDLYAVAAVGYFLLTGGPPFEGGSIMEICLAQINTPPTPPSSRGAIVSPELDAIILKGLAKKRDNRFASAREFAAALAACPTAGSWTAEQADAWWNELSTTANPPSATVTAEVHQVPTVTVASNAATIIHPANHS